MSANKWDQKNIQKITRTFLGSSTIKTAFKDSWEFVKQKWIENELFIWATFFDVLISPNWVVRRESLGIRRKIKYDRVTWSDIVLTAAIESAVIQHEQCKFIDSLPRCSVEISVVLIMLILLSLLPRLLLGLRLQRWRLWVFFIKSSTSKSSCSRSRLLLNGNANNLLTCLTFRMSYS